MNGWVGGLQEFSVSPSPLGTFCVFEIVDGVIEVGVLGLRVGASIIYDNIIAANNIFQIFFKNT